MDATTGIFVYVILLGILLLCIHIRQEKKIARTCKAFNITREQYDKLNNELFGDGWNGGIGDPHDEH